MQFPEMLRLKCRKRMQMMKIRQLVNEDLFFSVGRRRTLTPWSEVVVLL
jgi:hypothetical protein